MLIKIKYEHPPGLPRALPADRASRPAAPHRAHPPLRPPDRPRNTSRVSTSHELEGQDVSGADVGRIAAAALRISKGDVDQATAAAATVVHKMWGDNPAGLAADDLKDVLRGIIAELRPEPRCCVVC